MTQVREDEVVEVVPTRLPVVLIAVSCVVQVLMAVVLAIHAIHRPPHPTIWGATMGIVAVVVGLPIYYRAERTGRWLWWSLVAAVMTIAVLDFMSANPTPR